MKKILALLLCAAMLFSLFGCADGGDVYTPTGDGLTFDEDYTGPTVSQTEALSQQTLTLTYYPERSMNPFSSTDFTNRALFSLIYQGLFAVDRSYSPQPMLCGSYTITEDKKTYVFYPDSAATFSDGSAVTAQDILASLEAAKKSDYYSGRFLHIAAVSLSGDGGVAVQLNTVCETLPLLLDIPIVPQHQVEDPSPLGSGLYILETDGLNACLRRRENLWCKPDSAVTASLISLIAAENETHIRDEFEFNDLSLVCADPGSDKYADYRCDFELWDCENGIFLYLATSEASAVFSKPEVRTALTHAVDRELLVEDFYRGFARSATLPASPVSPYYSQALAEKYEYDPVVFAQAVEDAGVKGSEVVFLVNREDSLRLRVAREIAAMLEDCGLTVKMQELAGNSYRYALQTWNYDLYLGQTKLSPNMDLSPFFSESGSLSYGGVNDVAAYTLCKQALENHGNYYTLHQTVMENGLLCPILFRGYAVYAVRGLLTDLTPSRDNVFFYSIGKNMEQALVRNETQ